MRLSHGQAALAAMLYLLLMTYASTVVGPMGPHFVWRDPAGALHALLHVGFIANGSDQRADWMGNLMMLVPFGFLTAQALPVREPAAACLALLLCVLSVCGMKYLQLFFPPRTVTLNYITAQSVGALVGIAAWWCWAARQVRRVQTEPMEILVLALRLYLLALIVFLLEPLDFALGPADLLTQALRVPETLAALPGPDRPMVVRLFVLVAATLAFLPVGMLLSFVRTPDGWRPDRRLGGILIRALLLTMGIYGVSLLVMGAWPVLPSVAYRSFGIMAGAGLFRWLIRSDLQALLVRLRRAVPWLVPPYLAAVVLANRLASTQWLTPEQAVAQLHVLGLLPLFDYYIVSKANAAKDIAGHALMYFPVGAMIWLRAQGRDSGSRHGHGGLAFILGALLALVMEIGRYMRPALQGDINTVALGGLSAWTATRLMSFAWTLLSELARMVRRRNT